MILSYQSLQLSLYDNALYENPQMFAMYNEGSFIPYGVMLIYPFA